MPSPVGRGHALRTVALLLLVAVVFGRVAGHEFVNFDDEKFIYANDRYLPPTFTSLARLWGESHAHLYVPVTMSAWWLVSQVALVQQQATFELNPWVFHLASLLVHAANVLLVRRIVRTITRDDLAAVVGACLFAIHPLQTETVAWASELKDLLAAMFSLLAVCAAIEANGDGARRRWAWWSAAIVCFIAAMLSKPSAVTLPIIAVAVLWATGATPRMVVIVLLAGLLLAAPVAVVTRGAQPASDVPATAPWQRPLVAADAVAFYLGKLVWPVGMTVDYGRTPAAVFRSGAAYWTWLAPAAVTVAVLIGRRRALMAAWLIFLAAPAANLGLLPFDFQIVSTVADHYIYLGLLGVALAVACLIARFPRASPAATAVILILCVLTFMQAGRWRDSHALWRHAVDANPGSGLANVNLGATYFSDGDVAAALPLLIRAAEIDPHDAFAQLNLIRAHLAAGNTAAAAVHGEKLVAAYRRRSDFNPELVAAVLERFAAAVAAAGDAESAQRLRDEASRVRNR